MSHIHILFEIVAAYDNALISLQKYDLRANGYPLWLPHRTAEGDDRLIMSEENVLFHRRLI